MSSVGTNITSSGPKLNSSNDDQILEENSSILTAYLHRLAGYIDTEVNTVLKDHCYARPWNWRPENIYVKPTKNIFFSSSQERLKQSRDKKSPKDDFIDVECDDPPDELALPFNLIKSQHNMDELQKLVNFIRPDDDNTDDDWEETVEKTLWSPIQRRLFTRAFTIFRSERLSRLARSNCTTELFYRRSSIDTTTKRFREILASTGWDYRIIQWLHTSLISNLSREYLMIYLDILQTLRTKIPQLIDRMITPVQPNNNAVLQAGSVPLESLSALLKRPWDPISACLNTSRSKKLPGNPILAVITPGMNPSVSSRQHKWITQLGTLGMVVAIHSHLGSTANRLTMMAYIDQLVQTIRGKIQDVRSEFPGRPIILIGLNTGAALACQVAQMEHITAVVCLGFPFYTVESKRGSPDDTLMDIRCPVMFIVGQNANLVRPEELEDIRERMLVETSLVVVGTADDHLRISTAKIMSEGITQSMVDRCILDEIGDFIGGILLQPHPLPLRSTASLTNFEKSKKESRKRKSSTFNSVDNDTNGSNLIKKTRPSIERWHVPLTNLNSHSISKSSSAIQLDTTTEPTNLSTLVNNSTNNVAQSIQRRNARVSHSQKSISADQLQLTRRNIQNTNTPKSNGGLTLNIGSLASLAPIGPIRLTPNISCPTSVNSTVLKNSNTSKSSSTLPPPSIIFTKNSKMIQTSISPHNLSGKLTNSVPALSKTLSKTVTTSIYNKVMNKSEQTGESKLVTVYTSGGNQVRVASAINASAMQNKSMSSTTPLTAVLHSRKAQIINANGKVPTCSSASLLLKAPNELSDSMFFTSAMTTGTSTLVTTTTTKVMENSSPSSRLVSLNQDQDEKKITRKISKITSNTANSTIFQINKNTIINKQTTRKGTKNIHLENQVDEESSSLLKISGTPANPDDLGNILDIPIIFAKDGDNLNTISQKSIPSSVTIGSNSNLYRTHSPIQIGIPHMTTPRTVVLLSNREDNESSVRQSIMKNSYIKTNDKESQQVKKVSNNSNHSIILQSNMQNVSLSTNDNRNNHPTQINVHRSVAHLPTIKCTKIILSKKHNATNPSNNNSNNSNQVKIKMNGL